MILSLTTCSHPDEFVPNDSLTTGTGETLTKLGKKLEIPFTVENMQAAYDNLAKNVSVTSQGRVASRMDTNLIVEASHYYYRFLPKDSLEYETLVQDTIMDVSDVPFDYEIDSTGSYFQAPELIGISDFTWYYSVLPVDYSFPRTVEHEKLEEFYFPPELVDEDIPSSPTSRRTATLGEDFYDIWETEALRITNNLDEEDQASLAYLDNGKVNYASRSNWWWQRRKWHPSGTITVEEGVLTGIGSNNNIVGVAGAEIKIRKWGLLVIKKARTNHNGYYRAGGIRTKYVKYAIYFNNSDFKVKAGTVFWDARYRSTTRYNRRGWTRTFYEGGHTHFYSLVQNAAYDFYNNAVPIYGLKKPRYCRISAKYSNNRCVSSQHRPGVLKLLPISEIRVTRTTPLSNSSACRYRQSDGIYATTVHELAHASHREMDKGMFSIFHANNCSRAFLIESWAEGVETIVTNDRYRALDRHYFRSANDNIGWNHLRQTHGVNKMTEYTPIVADLYDYYDQYQEYPTRSPRPPRDRVNGYKLNQIQSALDNCRNIDCWENNLRDRFSNSSGNYLEELFDYMREARNNNNPKKCD